MAAQTSEPIYMPSLVPHFLTDFKLLQQGAESRLYVGKYLNKDTAVKQRFHKHYRHPELNSHLTLERMRYEVRGFLRCRKVGIRTPAVYLFDQMCGSLYYEYFKYSVPAKDFIQNSTSEYTQKLCVDIGRTLGKMHFNNIIHGDLTTSNMLVVNTKDVSDFTSNYDDLQLVMIDFGLSSYKNSAEDKAVDLYVLERTMECFHDNHHEMLQQILDSYQTTNEKYREVLTKLEEVRARGRKRTMVG